MMARLQNREHLKEPHPLFRQDESPCCRNSPDLKLGEVGLSPGGAHARTKIDPNAALTPIYDIPPFARRSFDCVSQGQG